MWRARFYPFPNLPSLRTPKGNRPAFTGAAAPALASQLYDAFNQALSAFVPVEVGVLGRIWRLAWSMMGR